VLIFHFTCSPYGNKTLAKTEGLRHFFEYGAQGVELFYIISGFVISYALSIQKYEFLHYPKFLLKRIFRIIPPYIFTIVCILSFSFYLNHFLWGTPFNLDFKKIFINLFYLADLFPNVEWINPIFATLKVEFQFYVLIGLLFPFIHKYKWFLVLSLITFITIGLYAPIGDTVFRNSPFFFSGILIFYITKKENLAFYYSLFVFVLCVLFIKYALQDFVVVILGSALLLFLPANFSVFKISGKISYSIYLTHGLVGGWFIYFISQNSFFEGQPILTFILAFVFSWCFAWLAFQLIEKPSIKLSKMIKYRKK